MTRINTTNVQAAVTPRLGEPSSRLSAQIRTLSSVANNPGAGQPVRSPLFDTFGGVSSFQPVVSPKLGGPAGQLAEKIRQRLASVQNGAARNLSAIEHSFTGALTQAEQQMVAAAPPEMQYALQQQLRQQHMATLEQLRGEGTAVNRPFTSSETQANAQAAVQTLNSSIDREFQSLTRHANTLLPQVRDQVLRRLDDERHYVAQQLQGPLSQMLRPGASLHDITAGRQQIDQLLSRSMENVRNLVAPMVPAEDRGLLVAELGMQQENQQSAVQSLFSRALQPKNPLDFSKLPGGAPPMQGKLTPTQAQRTLAQLESGIQRQYQLRMQQVNTLPPEQRMAAQFDAQAQRDRMLVTAYRNVLGRLTNPQPKPIPTPSPVLR